MPLKTKVLDWGKCYSLADLYDDARLEGFEVAIVESGIRGARMNLVSSPPFADSVQLDSNADDCT